MNNKILSKLARMQGAGAIKKLEFFAEEIKKEISEAQDAIFVLNKIDLLNEFIYKVPDTALQILSIVLSRKDLDMYDALVEKVTDALMQIRYYKPEEVFRMALDIFKEYNEHPSPYEYRDPKQASVEIIKKMAEYNSSVISHPKIGIGPQYFLLDTIKSWDTPEVVQCFEIVKNIFEKILYFGVEGFVHKEVDTFTINRGALVPSKGLIALRREALEFFFDTYDSLKSLDKKLELLQILSQVFNLPDTSDRDNYDKLKSVLEKELREVIIPGCKKIVYKDNRIIVPFSVVHEIEAKFYVFVINKSSYDLPTLFNFLDSLNRESEYVLYRLFVSNRFDFRDKVERESKLEGLVKEINVTNIEEWINKISSIAKHFGDHLERWQLQNYEKFIEQVVQKTDLKIAEKLYEAVMEKRLPERTMWGILLGLRMNSESKRLERWNQYVDEILQTQNVQLIVYVFASLEINHRVKTNFSEFDLSLLCEAVAMKGRFSSFDKDLTENHALRDYVFKGVLKILASEVLEDINKAQDLIRKEIENHPSCIRIYMDQLWMSLRNKEGRSFKLSKDFKDFLMGQLVEIKSLNYGEEILIATLGENDVRSIFNLFENRIRKEVVEWRKRDKKDRFSVLRLYDAVPSTLFRDLSEIIVNDSEYVKLMVQYVDNLRKDKIPMYQISSLYRELVTNKNKDVVLAFADRGTREDIEVAILLPASTHKVVDLSLCVELYKRILEHLGGDEDLEADLVGMLSNTGVVSGFNGISLAYKSKSEELKLLASKETDKRVSAFLMRQAKRLKDRAELELERAEEDKLLRKLEFDNK